MKFVGRPRVLIPLPRFLSNLKKVESVAYRVARARAAVNATSAQTRAQTSSKTSSKSRRTPIRKAALTKSRRDFLNKSQNWRTAIGKVAMNRNL